MTLITNEQTDAPEFDNIIVIKKDQTEEGWKEGILYKVQNLLFSPYRKTFFIDTDTYFTHHCDELFSLLEHYDLLIAHAPADTSKVSISNQSIEGYFPYNTGVIVFKKCDAVNQLFTDWLSIYKEKFKIYPHDQTPFMEALLINKIALYVLHPIYNFRTLFIVAMPSLEVKIVHGRLSDFESFERIINRKITHRAWIPKSHLDNLILEKRSWKDHLKRLLPSWFYKTYLICKESLANTSINNP